MIAKSPQEIEKKAEELIKKSHKITKSFVEEMDELIYKKTLSELKKKK